MFLILHGEPQHSLELWEVRTLSQESLLHTIQILKGTKKLERGGSKVSIFTTLMTSLRLRTTHWMQEIVLS